MRLGAGEEDASAIKSQKFFQVIIQPGATGQHTLWSHYETLELSDWLLFRASTQTSITEIFNVDLSLSQMFFLQSEALVALQRWRSILQLNFNNTALFRNEKNIHCCVRFTGKVLCETKYSTKNGKNHITFNFPSFTDHFVELLMSNEYVQYSNLKFQWCESEGNLMRWKRFVDRRRVCDFWVFIYNRRKST